jgi:hypothetical protein
MELTEYKDRESQLKRLNETLMKALTEQKPDVTDILPRTPCSMKSSSSLSRQVALKRRNRWKLKLIGCVKIGIGRSRKGYRGSSRRAK